MKYIADDLVRVKLSKGEEVVLGWGDPVEVDSMQDGVTQIRIQDADGTWKPGQVEGKLAVQDMGVLKFTLVDVQQGDGIVLETPGGKVMIIDGGDNQLFARYLAARVPEQEDFSGNLAVGADVLERGLGFYGRVIGRLALAAEKVEQSLGLGGTPADAADDGASSH